MKQVKLSSLKNIHVQARKWFDKINGNTYHSVKIEFELPTGELCHIKSGLTYGYWRQWEQTAQNLMCEHLGVMKKEKKLVAWEFFEKYGVKLGRDPEHGLKRDLWKEDVNLTGEN